MILFTPQGKFHTKFSLFINTLGAYYTEAELCVDGSTKSARFTEEQHNPKATVSADWKENFHSFHFQFQTQTGSFQFEMRLVNHQKMSNQREKTQTVSNHNAFIIFPTLFISHAVGYMRWTESTFVPCIPSHI